MSFLGLQKARFREESIYLRKDRPLSHWLWGDQELLLCLSQDWLFSLVQGAWGWALTCQG